MNLTRSTQNHKPARRIKVKARFYDELVLEVHQLRRRTENHDHNKQLLQQVVDYLRAWETHNTEQQQELDNYVMELSQDIRE